MVTLQNDSELDKKINEMIKEFLDDDGWVCQECGLGQKEPNKRMAILIKTLFKKIRQGDSR